MTQNSNLTVIPSYPLVLIHIELNTQHTYQQQCCNLLTKRNIFISYTFHRYFCMTYSGKSNEIQNFLSQSPVSIRIPICLSETSLDIHVYNLKYTVETFHSFCKSTANFVLNHSLIDITLPQHWISLLCAALYLESQPNTRFFFFRFVYIYFFRYELATIEKQFCVPIRMQFCILFFSAMFF